MRDHREIEIAHLGTVDYAAALELQAALVAARLRDEIPDIVLLLEHPHVYTLGRGADERFLLNRAPAIPVFRISRGGQVTYHGPGQLIGYPIIKLEGQNRDVIRYLRQLEEVIIRAARACGIEAGRREGLTGVWVRERKLASIGVGLRRWTTSHGFAINVTTDLGYFDHIVPCGIAGCRTTSLAALGAPGPSLAAFPAVVAESFVQVFGYSGLHCIDPPELERFTRIGERDNLRGATP